MHHVYNIHGNKETLDSVLHGPDSSIWTKIISSKFGRLTQGNIHGVTPTDTMDFIHKKEVSKGRDVTYANFILNYRSLKSEPSRVRLVVGGDKLAY